MIKQVTLIDWTDLLFHAQELGFEWNYAHELLRVFQGYDRIMDVECSEIANFEPMSDEYIGGYFKEQIEGHGDVNQMGRDIVYDFMQKHELTVMTVASD